MDPNLSPEMLERAEKLSAKLEKIELNPSYIAALQTMTQLQKDNFEMIDRSLAMMQALHTAETKNDDYFLDILKFLIPIFATAAITGASITITGLNSLLLMTIGTIGLVVSVVFLTFLSLKRKKKIDRHQEQYVKLAEAFSKWQKLIEIQKQIASDSGVEVNDMKELFADLVGAAELVENQK